MIEFIFGFVFGAWVAQQFALPSVHNYVQQLWQPSTTEEDNEETIPIFTGDIPAPSV